MSHPTTILVLTPSIGGFYFGELLIGLGREVTAVGGRLVLVQTLDGGVRSIEASGPADFSTPVASSQVDGVISITTAVDAPYLRRLREAGKPVVLVSTRLPGFDAPLALPDNRGGTIAAVEHLIAHGHTRIGFVGNLGQADMRDRYAAFQEALAAHGLPDDPALLFTAVDNESAGGAQAAHAVLTSAVRPTALMVATDRNAIALMDVLTAAGLNIPRDLAVVGFDNVEAAAFSSPPLSSVNQRFDEVGALAGRLVLDELRGVPTPYAAHTLPTAAVELRGSCGCATDVVGGGIAAIDCPADCSPEQALAELQDTVGHALLSGHGPTDAAMRETVAPILARVAGLLDSGADIAATDIRHLTGSLQELTERPEVLRRVTRAVIEYVQRRGAPGPGRVPAPETAVGQLTTALWQVQAGAFLRQSEMTQTTLEEQYVVDAALLEAARRDPRSLDWLAVTHVRVGALALWEDGPESGRLRITDVHDPEGLLGDTIPGPTTADRFPPADMIGAARTVDRHACIVVPVANQDGDWGLLAVISEINTTSTLETYHHWATQLCAVFEEEALQRTVRASADRHTLAARATNDGMWELDVRTSEFYMSERCCVIVGLPAVVGPGHLERWQALVHPDDIGKMLANVTRIVGGEIDTITTEYRIRTGDGSYRWLLSRALSVRGPDGTVERLVGSLADVHERRALEDQLRENALYDPLTGLPNRRLFLSRLDHAVELWQRSETPYAVIFLDLDGFKAINDSLGHQMGDRVLSVVGDRIGRELRGVDTGARFGGDEFAILLHDVDHDDVVRVARRVQVALAEMVDVDGHEFAVGASLGIASSAIDYASAEAVLRDADVAMYHAKETERGTMCFFDAAMHAHAVHQSRLNEEIRLALDEGQFEMHYQPIVDLGTGQADRFEALVRWRHPGRGLLLPGEFLPLMAEKGLIVSLSRWLIDDVCRQLAAWGPAVANVAVNVSDHEFWHSDLLNHVLAGLKRHDLDAGRLTLEIAEDVIGQRPEVALRIMRGLHDAGLQLHVDDFGSGHSSLATLHRFPIDALKVDRSFVSRLAPPERVDEIVGALIALGTALGVAVEVEGIETGAEVAFLQRVGCTTGQGPLFLGPVPAADVPAVLGRVLCAPAAPDPRFAAAPPTLAPA